MRALDSDLAALGVLVCIVIAALLAIALMHGRPASDADDGARTANAIVGIGTVISTVLRFGALVAMPRVLAAIAQPPQRAAFTLRVTSNDCGGKRRSRTTLAPQGAAFDTAHEIPLPVGAPVAVELDSAESCARSGCRRWRAARSCSRAIRPARCVS